ncbi:MAG TPA: helix-turn-helix transcriptional regulator [Vitreimonas sp.]|nr:helix-turn-helix transcriptional regulator [Vitreimonas sp.]
MNKKLNTILKKKTITLEEFAKDFTLEQKQIVELELLYYDILVELRKMRKKLHLTQAEVAKRANLPRTTITKIESGSYNPTLNTLMTIASAFNKKLKIQFV